MRTLLWAKAGASAFVLVFWAGVLFGCQPSGDVPALAEPSATTATSDEEAGLCPWREPQSDMARFFPGTTGTWEYRQELLALSSRRLEIIKRLGPGQILTSNLLYAYNVRQNSKPVGTVLVRRVRGEWGAIELVVALHQPVPNRPHVVKQVRIQRHREPPEVAAFLESPQFLDDFRGKDATHRFRLGRVPNAPQAARVSAEAVTRAVRALLIEHEVARSAYKK